MTTPETTEAPFRSSRGGVLAFLAWRIAGTILLLFVLSVFVFSLLYLAPGDVARNLLGTHNVTQGALAQIRAQYHLNEPLVNQYLYWLSHAVRGDFGVSIRSGGSVSSLIGSRIGVTTAIVLMSFVLAVIVGIPMGLMSALHRGGWLDRFIVGVSVVGVSAPAFAIGLILLYVFAVGLGWFPVYGPGSGFIDGLWHLALPAVTLALGLGAFVVKLTRVAVIRELDSDYVTFARSRGLGEPRVRRIVLRNAAIPIVTSLGLLVAYLIGGTVLVEVTFALPGLGTLMEESVLFKDFPVVQALTLLVALAVSLTALLVDIGYLLIDPRVRARTVRR